VDRAGIRDFRATGSVLVLPYFLTLKAEALHLADRTSEALEAINEAEGLVERFEQRYCYAELHRLRGVFVAALGAEETQLRLRSAKPSESQRSGSGFRWRNAPRQPTQNTFAKKLMRQEDVDSGCLLVDAKKEIPE
jgi:hypothetical protein